MKRILTSVEDSLKIEGMEYYKGVAVMVYKNEIHKKIYTQRSTQMSLEK